MKLDQLLSLIGDGAWHNLKEMAKCSDISKQKVVSLSKLLSEANIIEYETKKSQVRIRKEWQEMLKDTHEDQKWEKAAVGTIVLPPKKSVNIQGIWVTNLTKKELELGMRVNKELEELAVGVIG